METRGKEDLEVVKPRKVCGATAVVDGADCRFVRIKNNLFRVAAIKSIRIEGVSLKVFLLEEMYARVEFDTAEKAWACWESLTRELCAGRRRGREESEAPGTEAKGVTIRNTVSGRPASKRSRLRWLMWWK